MSYLTIFRESIPSDFTRNVFVADFDHWCFNALAFSTFIRWMVNSFMNWNWSYIDGHLTYLLKSSPGSILVIFIGKRVDSIAPKLYSVFLQFDGCLSSALGSRFVDELVVIVTCWHSWVIISPLELSNISFESFTFCSSVDFCLNSLGGVLLLFIASSLKLLLLLELFILPWTIAVVMSADDEAMWGVFKVLFVILETFIIRHQILISLNLYSESTCHQTDEKVRLI